MVIGRYKLLQQIGEGGCGVVYMAEQEAPMRRRVALKIIKLGMDSKQVVARFEAERQALAMMDHPNIAKVFDGGIVSLPDSQPSSLNPQLPLGRPYFVMELVRGVRITDFCDQHRLPNEERLKLFLQVCHAVQHAHQKSVVHRDLKPSNILVSLHDDVPVAKVIDFGIAKAIGQRLTDKTVFTNFEHFIGTPAYMSPEQAGMSGLDIDTRSDIYALGVLLYELLTGRTPFDPQHLAHAGLEEILRRIREEDPPKPSTRLGTLQRDELTTTARQRQTEPPRLIHLLRGDLDWIVMKCLEKNRTRRYETANALAVDLERHLRHEPVLARPPSTVYQVSKFVRRHRVGVVAGTSVFLALVLGLSGALLGLARAHRAESRASAAAARSRHTANFLMEMLEGVGPSVALGRDTTLLREILDKTAERVGKELKDQPEVEADLRWTLGEVYRTLGRYPQAEAMHREALALRKRCLAGDDPKIAWSLEYLALVLQGQGKLAEAETLQREALAFRRRILGPDDVQIAASLSDLSAVLYARDQLVEAEDLQRQALAMRRKLLGDEHEWVAMSLNNLAVMLVQRGQWAEAEHLHRQALAMKRKLLKPDHPEIAPSLNNLAAVLACQGKFDAADPLYREALALYRKLHGDQHRNVATALANLGANLRLQGRLDQAETCQREALDMRRKLLGEDHPDVALSLYELARLLAQNNLLGEAEKLHRDALALRRKQAGNNPAKLAVSLDGLARVLLLAGRPAEAEPLARECLATRETGKPGDWRLASARCLLGQCLLARHDYAAAEKLLLSGYDTMLLQKAQIPAESRDLLNQAARCLVRLYETTNRDDLAARWRKNLADLDPAPTPPPATLPKP